MRKEKHRSLRASSFFLHRPGEDHRGRVGAEQVTGAASDRTQFPPEPQLRKSPQPHPQI